MATIDNLINSKADIYYQYNIVPDHRQQIFNYESERKYITSLMFPCIKKKIIHGADSWSVHKLKVKSADEKQVLLMRSMLNKMSDKTYEKFAFKSKELNYESPEIIALIFNKIVLEPKNTELYINFCEKLYDMSIFSEICLEQFMHSEEQIGLCPFIATLYNRDIISNLASYIDLIFKNSESELKLPEESIIILGTLLKNAITLDKKSLKSLDQYKNVIADLSGLKNDYESRCRCLIMDLEDLMRTKKL